MIIIDRFEEDKAVLETDAGFITVDRNVLPIEAREGDVLVFDGTGYFIDEKKRNNREKHIRSLVNDLFND